MPEPGAPTPPPLVPRPGLAPTTTEGLPVKTWALVWNSTPYARYNSGMEECALALIDRLGFKEDGGWGGAVVGGDDLDPRGADNAICVIAELEDIEREELVEKLS